MLLATALVLELVRESLTGTHCRYRQYINGLPSDEYVTRPCDAEALLFSTAEHPQLNGAVEPAASLRTINGRVVRRKIIEDEPLQPHAYDYDVVTGELLRRVPMFFRGKPARVFDPNPVVTLNDPALQDRNDQGGAIPLEAYFDVELENTIASGSLAGLFVTLVDRQPPAIAPPDAGALLVFDREHDGFEDVNAYFHIDRAQRYLQNLGYRGARGVAAYAIPVDAHAASGADNSFFLPSSSVAGRGSLFFGEGGTDDAEDADLLVHEYTHAIHEWIAPGTFGGSFASEARALAEGMADYWAYSTHAQARRASGRDPFCFADWDARCALDEVSERCAYAPDANCLRRLDSEKTMADYLSDDAQGVEHRNGAIWSSALREIHDRVGKQIADTILIESLFGAPPRPTFAVMALRLLETDRLLHQGVYAGAICSAMFTRGILTRCDVLPRGEWTLFQSQERGLRIPENSTSGVTSTILITDSRAIENVQVRVDIEHPSRGDLRVGLIAPDGTEIVLHEVSNVRSPDIHVTYGLGAVPVESLDVLRGRSAAGEWTLTVSDRRPLDVGTLQSWGLVIQFVGDAPLDDRPHGGPSQMIPVVGHLYGADEALFQSDVRIANVSDLEPREATLIFTRSGEDGLARFAAVGLAIPPGQTLALDDVLDTVFHTAGSGSLEVLGDVAVSSRTHARRNSSGTLGQLVPAHLETTTLDAAPLLVAALVTPIESRINFGLTETAGAHGVVKVGDREIAIDPFSHVQFPVAAELLEVRVIAGEARVCAYLSQVELDGDAMFIPAERAVDARTRIAPAITTPDSWRSDLWVASRAAGSITVEAFPGGTVTAAIPALFEDVLALLFSNTVTLAALQVTQPAHTFAATRIVFDGTTQFVPLLDPPVTARQDLLFVESSDAFRTNIGIVTTGPAVAEVSVRDSSGREVRAFVLRTSGGMAQLPVSETIIHARAVVTFVEGTGRGYASLIDRRSLDATFIPGQ